MLKILLLLLIPLIIHNYNGYKAWANKTKNLFLECSCLHAQDHNGTSSAPALVSLNASTVRYAKNDCFIIFVTGSNEEIVSIRFRQLQLRPKRQKAAAARKPSNIAPVVEPESEALRAINEIFNPSLKIPVSTGPYRPPDELTTDDFDAMRDLDVRKLAELKEVFLLFDTDCDGLLSKDDLRFTFGALGSDATDEMIEEMLKEAKEPLDVDAFIELMSHRTVELDPEDVLLEAWSKWDLYGTGKIEEKNCLDYIEIFPYLREPVVENTTLPEYVFCNRTQISIQVSPQNNGNNSNSSKNNTIISSSSSTSRSNSNTNKTISSTFTMSNIGSHANISSTSASTTTIMHADDLPPHEFIYSSGKIFAIRLRFTRPVPSKIDNWYLNVSAEYRFLKKENFKNDGRLIPGTFCDYYFFANAEAAPTTLDVWKYFHSPRFPAKYPSHIKCSYKFIGRPETRVEVIFEELRVPRKGTSCNLDKLTIFDAESANMNAVIDVLCGLMTNTRHILSTGPDLLIEFNASSNVTSKGFRGKFKFVQNDFLNAIVTDSPIVAGEIQASNKKQSNVLAFNIMDNSKVSKGFKEGNCKEIYDSRWNKTGVFESSQLFSANVRLANVNNLMPLYNTGRVECIYEFYASGDERVQIKFLDFNIPTEHKNTTECKPNDSLQLLTQVKGKYEAVDYYCGAFLPKPIMSKGPKLMLQFIGKYPNNQQKVGYYGFKAEYKFLTNFGITTGYQLGHNCSFVFNSTTKKTGFFTSPNFPGLYPQNIACHYFFYGEFEEKVKINFSFFDVEGIDSCGYLTASDYVEFSNFISIDRKFPRYCGKRDKFEIRSDDRFFRVSFYSNDRFDRNGFRAYYEFEGKSIPSENTSVQSYTSVLSHCGPNVKLNYFVKLVALLIYGLRVIFL